MGLRSLAATLSRDRATMAWLSLGLVLIIGASIGSLLALDARSEAESRVRQTLLMRELLAGVLSLLQDAEGAQRGYIITGEEAYLEPYGRARRTLGPRLGRLAGLTSAREQRDRIQALGSLVASRLSILQEGIDERRRAGLDAGADVTRSGRGKALMDRIRDVVAELDVEESRLLAEREAVANRRERWLLGFTASASALGLLLVGTAVLYAARTRRAAAAAYQHLRETERRVRASEARYRTLFESIDEGYCIVGVIFDEHGKPVDYRFLETSPSFEKQTGLADANGRTIREMVPGHEEYWYEVYGAIARTGKPARFQNRAEQLGRWYDVYAFRFGEPEDRQVAILFNDITERKRAEESLEAANRELAEFATVVSHDLKTPLRAVSALAKWVQDDYADKLDDGGRKNLAEIVSRVGRMDQMIDDVLSYSRLGRVEEKPELVALDDLVSAVVHELAPPAWAHVTVAPGMPVVRGEPVRLRQLFQNLIGNAIQHADQRAIDVRVGWADAGSFWQFSVADNGPGIPERHFERIFRIFQTLAPKELDSTGVGLALVKRIVERAGGRVWVESRVGEGSTFHFTWHKARQRGRQGRAGAGTVDRGVA